jgi:hypothetical protein
MTELPKVVKAVITGGIKVLPQTPESRPSTPTCDSRPSTPINRVVKNTHSIHTPKPCGIDIEAALVEIDDLKAYEIAYYNISLQNNKQPKSISCVVLTTDEYQNLTPSIRELNIGEFIVKLENFENVDRINLKLSYQCTF